MAPVVTKSPWCMVSPRSAAWLSTSDGALEAFLALDLDAAAGIRQPLERFAMTNSGVRVLRDNFTEIRQAMATPVGRAIAADYVQGFITRCVTSGLVTRELDGSGERNARVIHQNFVP